MTDLMHSPLPEGWAPVFASAAPAQQQAMHRLRALVLEVAEEVHAAPLTETLKWGQPAWLTEATGTGTTLRMGAVGADQVALFVHCQTDLVDRYRAQFPGVFDYDGTRAIRIRPDSDWPDLPLRAVIGQALTYQRDRKRARR